jgi:MarR family transcriptional regulator, organic hydroperoxide resistance regulator
MDGSREPQRFRALSRRARRDRDVSRAAVAILRADSRVSQALERSLANANLTLPQFNVLMELAAAPGEALPLYELNARLVATPPNTSWITTRMEKAGLVTKRRDTADARVVILALTEAGWETLERALPLVVDAERRLLADYDRDDLRTLEVLLGRLTAASPREEAPAKVRKGEP